MRREVWQGGEGAGQLVLRMSPRVVEVCLCWSAKSWRSSFIIMGLSFGSAGQMIGASTSHTYQVSD